MKIFKDIDFSLSRAKFKEKVKINKENKLNEELNDLLAEALPLVQPKALFKIAYVEDRYEDGVKIGDTVFKSKVMSDNLQEINRVFPYVATCGNELEEMENRLDDYLKKYWLDTLKEMAARRAHSFLRKYIRKEYRIEKLSAMNPGSGDINLWPIEEQEKLFSILGNVEEAVGVRLTDSFLMLPNKSMSGIFFPSKSEYVNCEYCHRKDCPGRKAPYKGD